MWILQTLEIADNGKRTGRFRLTATSDEDGGGPFGDTSHDHATREEAQACDRCEEYCSQITGLMSRKKILEAKEARDRSEYERLKAKYEPEWTPTPEEIREHRALDHTGGVITAESDSQVIARLRNENRTGRKTFAWQTISGADLGKSNTADETRPSKKGQSHER